ncbi:MAG: hypothetical protein ACP5QA_02005 [Phycisphaerae bacterium]
MTDANDYDLKPQLAKPAAAPVARSTEVPTVVVSPPTSSPTDNVEAAQLKKQAAAEEEEDIRKNKGMALLSYLGVLVVIPMIFGLHSKFVRHHANQGLLLFTLEMVVWAACKTVLLLGYPLLHLSAMVYLTSLVGGLIWLGFTLLALLGLLHVAGDSYASLPVIGEYEIISILGSDES